jgi:hypothetical protein
MYENRKIRCAETVPRMGEGERDENKDDLNLTKLY